MIAAEENLKQVASHPSCQCLFQGSVCRGGLAIRLLHCIKGMSCWLKNNDIHLYVQHQCVMLFS